MNEEQQRQWEIDITEYGNNAYLMWSCKPDGFLNKNSEYQDCLCNKNLSMCGAVYKRKDSAALPFNIERAKAGDTVEWLNNDGKWEFVPQNNLVYLHGQDARLRMKYPPKISVTEETEYCTYPECHCPFDAPSNNPDWCAIGLPHKPK